MRTKGRWRQLPPLTELISVWLACRLSGIDPDKTGGFQFVDVLPQTGGGDPIFLRGLLRENEFVHFAALHSHAEIEKPAACAERVEPLREEQGVSHLDESFFFVIHLGG